MAVWRRVNLLERQVRYLEKRVADLQGYLDEANRIAEECGCPSIIQLKEARTPGKPRYLAVVPRTLVPREMAAAICGILQHLGLEVYHEPGGYRVRAKEEAGGE